MSSQLSLFDGVAKPPKVEVPLEQEIEPISVNKDVPGMSLPDLVPDDAVLELSRTYPTRASHVSRILRLAVERRSEMELVKRDEVASELGISWARVRGTMNVMRRSELLKPKNAPTPFGSLVYAYSPYLDNTGLLWLLHFLLASSANLVLWSHIFNQLLLGAEETSIADLAPRFLCLAGRWSAPTLEDKVPREIGGILRTYADDMFAPLGILAKRDKGTYDVFSNTAVIPPLIWLSCLLTYRDRYYPGVPSLEVRLIADGNYSPGRILRQKEAAVRRALDELHNAEILTVETRSGLDQVRFKREVTWLSAVHHYLEDQRSR